MKANLASKNLLRAVMFVAVVAPLAYPQMGAGRRHRMPNYDPASEVTLKGTVEEVVGNTGRRGWNATHLKLNTGDQTVDVHLGPSTFLKQQGFEFAKGDRVEVTGSKIKFAGADAVIARELKKNNQTLTLRDDRGIPRWSRGGIAQPGQ